MLPAGPAVVVVVLAGPAELEEVLLVAVDTGVPVLVVGGDTCGPTTGLLVPAGLDDEVA